MYIHVYICNYMYIKDFINLSSKCCVFESFCIWQVLIVVILVQLDVLTEYKIPIGDGNIDLIFV